MIKTIAVIGAGSTGRAIARTALLAGYQTILEDFSTRTLDDARAWLASTLNQTPQALAGLTTVTSIEDALRHADLVIEASAEEMEAKIELFTIFDKFAKPNAILASASPSLSVADMASVTLYAERCMGMRFGDAVENLDFIELVTTRQTSAATLEACREVVHRMGKKAVMLEQPERTAEKPPLNSAASQH